MKDPQDKQLLELAQVTTNLLLAYFCKYQNNSDKSNSLDTQNIVMMVDGLNKAILVWLEELEINNHDKRHLGDGIYAQIKDDELNTKLLRDIIAGAADLEDGETGTSKCISIYCKENGISEEIADAACNLSFKEESGL